MIRRAHLRKLYGTQFLSDKQEGEWDYIERQIKLADAWEASMCQVSLDRLEQMHEQNFGKLKRILDCVEELVRQCDRHDD